MLGSAKYSTKTASNRSASLVEANFANVLMFEFLLCRMTSMEAMENELSYSFAFFK